MGWEKVKYTLQGVAQLAVKTNSSTFTDYVRVQSVLRVNKITACFLAGTSSRCDKVVCRYIGGYCK
jgi:hypothetical protein